MGLQSSWLRSVLLSVNRSSGCSYGNPMGPWQAACNRAVKLSHMAVPAPGPAGSPQSVSRHGLLVRPQNGRALTWSPSASLLPGILVGIWCRQSGRISRGSGCFAGIKSVSTMLSGERGTSSVSMRPDPAAHVECRAMPCGMGLMLGQQSRSRRPALRVHRLPPLCREGAVGKAGCFPLGRCGTEEEPHVWFHHPPGGI